MDQGRHANFDTRSTTAHLLYCMVDVYSHSQLTPHSTSNKRKIYSIISAKYQGHHLQLKAKMKLFSASAYLIASLACVAASSPSDINDVNCPRSPDVTKNDLDRFLGLPEFDPPVLCGFTNWPWEANPDLHEYLDTGPAADDRRREAFESLLKKLNWDAEDRFRAKWPQLVRPRDTSEGSAINSDWSGGERSSLTADDFLQDQIPLESDDGFGFGLQYCYDELEEPVEEPVDFEDLY